MDNRFPSQTSSTCCREMWSSHGADQTPNCRPTMIGRSVGKLRRHRCENSGPWAMRSAIQRFEPRMKTAEIKNKRVRRRGCFILHAAIFILHSKKPPLPEQVPAAAERAFVGA